MSHKARQSLERFSKDCLALYLNEQCRPVTPLNRHSIPSIQYPNKAPLFNRFKNTVPSRAMLPTEPNHRGLTDNSRFRHKAPIPAVLASVPVIAHHPVIIIFKSILIGRFSVNYKVIPVLYQCMMFVSSNNSSVDRYILSR